jgi:hypothetical protein
MGKTMRKLLAGAMLIVAMAPGVAAQPLSDEARQQKLDLQERCAQAAARSFRLSGWKAEYGSAYQSHYNRTLGACLIEIEGRSQYGVTKSVSDAVEGRTYAIYMWVVNGNKPCQLVPSEKERRDCATEEEYKAFAASLMEQP